MKKNTRNLRINYAPGGSCAEAPAGGYLVVRTQQPFPDSGGSVKTFGLFRKKNVGQQNRLWEKSRSVGMEGRQNKTYY